MGVAFNKQSEQNFKELQSRLKEKGVNTKVFRSNLYHQWFLCMWTSAQRKKLQIDAKQHEAVIVLGCDSATETVRDAVKSTDCKVIEGMEVAGAARRKRRNRYNNYRMGINYRKAGSFSVLPLFFLKSNVFTF